MVLYGGDIVIHSWIVEREHNLLLDEGYSLEFSTVNLLRFRKGTNHQLLSFHIGLFSHKVITLAFCSSCDLFAFVCSK